MQHMNSLAFTTLTEKIQHCSVTFDLRAVKSVGISDRTVKFPTTQSARPLKLFSNTWMMNLSLECFPVGTYCFFHKCGPLSPHSSKIFNHPTSLSRPRWQSAARSHHLSTLKQLRRKQAGTAWFFSPTEPLCRFCVRNENQ